MKKLILAACLVAAGATTASAEFRTYGGGYRFVDTRHHQLCDDRAERIRHLERDAREAREQGREESGIRYRIRELRTINATTCGRNHWPY